MPLAGLTVHAVLVETDTDREIAMSDDLQVAPRSLREGLHEDIIGDFYGQVPDSAMCNSLLFLGPRRGAVSSVPPEYWTCVRYLELGTDAYDIITKLLDLLDDDESEAWRDEVDKDTTPTDHDGDPETPPIAPSSTWISATVLPLWQLVQAKSDPLLSEADARTLATECAARVTADDRIPASYDGWHPCAVLPIFAPAADNALATENKIAAINSGQPALINFLSGENQTLPQQWYYAESSGTYCSQHPRPFAHDCDEYPFRSSAQAGPGAHTSYVPESANRSEGGKLGTFQTGCELVSGYTDWDTHLGDPFLVIPTTELPTTLGLCGRHLYPRPVGDI